MARKMNFNAGPAALPLPALERAREELLDLAGERHVGDGAQPPRQGVRGGPRRGPLAPPRAARGAGHPRDPLPAGRRLALFAQIPMNLMEKGKAAAVPGHRRLGREGGRRGQDRLGAARRQRRHQTTGDRRRQGEELRPCPGARRGQGGPGRRPTCTSPRTRPSTASSSTWTPARAFPRHRRRAARRRHVERLPLAPLRRLEVRHRLRRGPEEHRPLGHRGGHRLEGTGREGAQGHPQDLPVPHPRREQVALQHAAHLRRLHGAQRARLAEGAGRPRRHGGGEPQEGGAPLRRHRREPGLLPVPGGEGEPLGDERRLPAAHRGARGAVRRRGEEARAWWG